MNSLRLLVRHLFLLLGLALAGGLAASPAMAEMPAFYTVADSDVPGAPGSIIRVESLDGAPAGASAWRIIYRSTDPDGRPVAVSGMVFIPARPAPAGGRPVVAWAHPTSGVIAPCAPSQSPLRMLMIPGLGDLLARGYIVTASDYAGLGVGGPHPFLIGESEARAVLDSVRAAINMPDAAASRRFALWGHSQGGQSALFSAIRSGGYAPELNLLGVAVASPATDLATLFTDSLSGPGGKNVASMALWAWSKIYNVPLDRVVLPAALPKVDMLAQQCIGSIRGSGQRRAADKFLADTFLSVPNLTAVEPWKSIAARNTPGETPAGVPVFIAQGMADELVRPSVTIAYARSLCAAGRNVTIDTMPGVKHAFAAFKSAGEVIKWIDDRFAGTAPAGDCATLAAQGE